MEADTYEGGEADAGNKDGEEKAAEDSLSCQTPSPSASGVNKIGPRIAQEHPAGLSQDARLSGLVSLLWMRVCV